MTIGETTVVGCYPDGASPFGCEEMSGNVWERCQDHFSESVYDSHAAANPLWEKAGPDRVIRGGGWNLDAWSIRCTRRMGFSQDYAGPALGFRLVMEL